MSKINESDNAQEELIERFGDKDIPETHAKHDDIVVCKASMLNHTMGRATCPK